MPRINSLAGNRPIFTSMALLPMLGGASAVAGDMVQWTTASGGNGHWYQGISAGAISWEAANTIATSKGGHLVTLATANEFDWVVANVASDPDLWYQLWGPHIGGFQDTAAPDFAEPGGGWRWVTGESWAWSDWGGCGPDNYGGGQNHLAIGRCTSGAPNVFNDADLTAAGPENPSFIIEWDSLCPADLNGDSIVNGADLSVLLGFWGLRGTADVNDDGVVNGAYIAIVLGSWGPCP